MLPTLPAESVQCVVTSPPYYGLRDYGTALWDGGDAACDHSGRKNSGEFAPRDGNGGEVFRSGSRYINQGNATLRQCACGAVRVDRQIGLEATPDEYLATMVGVFRQIRRVMRSDAVAFINMGDSYSDKQLLLMPARLALALQRDGWWVRSDIIWHKPNPMPESVTDRPTITHEHVFLLTRSARYFYDADAVREDAESGRFAFDLGLLRGRSQSGDPRVSCEAPSIRERQEAGINSRTAGNGMRNLRNVWTIATHAYPDAHFATFPPELSERCIKAGTSERGCCGDRGAPLRRVTDRTFRETRGKKEGGGLGLDPSSNWAGMGNGVSDVTTVGWQETCDCRVGIIEPCTVLDPFAGAGTTLLVADRLQRDAIGIELNTAYTEMAMERCRADAPLFTSFPPAEPPEDERMGDLFTDMAAD